MEKQQRVLWSEGMLVSPHHLQQLDLYHEGLVDVRVSALAHHATGVLELDVDAPALHAGNFALRRFRAVLPGGMVVDFTGGAPDAPSARPIEASFPSTRQVLEVYLAVSKERATTGNVARADEPAARKRFRASTRKVVDLVTGESELDVEFAVPALVYLFGGESRDDYESIQVAELVRGPDGTFALNGSFVPPLLSIGASPVVVEGLRRLLTLATARQRALASERRHRDKGTVDYDASEVTSFLLANALHTYLPLLKHLVDARDLTAHATYLILLQMGGQLTSFSATEDPTTFPAYAHGDLRRTFPPLFARLEALIQATLPGRLVAMELTSRDDGMHFGRFTDERARKDGARYFLAVSCEMPEAKVATVVPRLAKIASWERIAALVGAALPGAHLEPDFRPPREIPTRAGTTYYAIPSEDPHMKEARKEGTLAVHLPPPFEPSKVRLELFAVLPAAD